MSENDIVILWLLAAILVGRANLAGVHALVFQGCSQAVARGRGDGARGARKSTLQAALLQPSDPATGQMIRPSGGTLEQFCWCGPGSVI